jgi:CO/xanthine dehydrogenase Mo-binding subunit/aerobic-type carbon monoxide dehydrogenase small subunit (CoxS/CutS family)
MAEGISLVINGEKVKVRNEEGSLTLLTFLREKLGLLGAKNGCNQGHCGTCTVIINGRAQKSCVWKLSRLNESKIETIENLSKGGSLHPLQLAFMETGAIQCGFCTPGMIMSAKALLDKNKQPSTQEVKKALKANICRCTGYQKIIEAIQLAASYLRENREFTIAKSKELLAAKEIRNDALEKVTGKPLYVDDLFREGMLYGKLHLSSEPHAEIIEIDTSKAEKIPGVVEVLTAEDIPGEKDFGLIINHQPVLAYDKVRYIGDPIALVIAESQEAAAKGVEEIEVKYKQLPTYYSPAEALVDDAVDIHEDGNILTDIKLRKGNYEDPFAEADVIIEDTYQTPFTEHAYLEPEGCLAEYIDGRIIVWTPSQDSYEYRNIIAASLNLSEDKVRVITTCTGGAFGGREEPTVQVHTALAALLLKRPVKMVLTREESIRISTKRHAAYLHYKTGATKDGKLVGAEVEIYTDTGAYASAGQPVAGRATSFALGPYQVANAKVDVKAVYTNNLPGGAFRGFGAPQVCFAAEIQMDRLAEKLGMDPIELRLKNALEDGRDTLTGEVVAGGIGFKDCLIKLQEAIAKEEIVNTDNKKRAWGIAAAYKNVGLGTGLEEETEARIELNSDGSFTLYVGCIDSGQGSDTAMAQIAATALGIDYREVKVLAGDTELTPDIGVTTGSRMVFLSGNAVKGAAEGLKDKILKAVAEVSGVSIDGLYIEDGEVKDKDTRDLVITLAEIANKDIQLFGSYKYIPPRTAPLAKDAIPATPTAGWDKLHFAYCYAAHGALVEWDQANNDVKVLKVIAAHDLGKTINLKSVEGQIEGGVAMGLGYALSEDFYLQDGRLVQDNLLKLKLPKTTDMPEVKSILIEENHPDGPYGAKGMSELPVAPVAPAVVNALYRLTGKRLTKIPIDIELLKSESESK